MTRRLALLAAVALAGCVPAHTMTPEGESAGACPGASASSAGSPGATRVAWWGPAQEGDAEILRDWCAHVGPPAWTPGPARPALPPGPDARLRVLSWNTNGGSGDVLAFLEEELGYDCDAETPRPPAFVLLLQEALRRSNAIPDTEHDRGVPLALDEPGRATERLGVDGVAERCGLALLYVPSARNGHAVRDGLREDRGNAILASLPLSDPGAVELPFEGSRRVAVTALVSGPGGRPLRVASVHFHTIAKPWRLMTTGGGSRLREAAALVDVVKAVDAPSDGKDPVAALVAGDFNTWSSGASALRRLRGYFVDSPAPLAEPTRGPFPTDHLFFRAGGTAGAPPDLVATDYRRIDATYNSDHHPIAASVRTLP